MSTPDVEVLPLLTPAAAVTTAWTTLAFVAIWVVSGRNGW